MLKNYGLPWILPSSTMPRSRELRPHNLNLNWFLSNTLIYLLCTTMAKVRDVALTCNIWLKYTIHMKVFFTARNFNSYTWEYWVRSPMLTPWLVGLFTMATSLKKYEFKKLIMYTVLKNKVYIVIIIFQQIICYSFKIHRRTK